MMMSEPHNDYERNRDSVDQNWSSPDGTYPNGNADSGAEMYNYETDYANDQMYFNNNIEQQYENTQDTHGPCDFDDSYHYDHDYTY